MSKIYELLEAIISLLEYQKGPKDSVMRLFDNALDGRSIRTGESQRLIPCLHVLGVARTGFEQTVYCISE